MSRCTPPAGCLPSAMALQCPRHSTAETRTACVSQCEMIVRCVAHEWINTRPQRYGSLKVALCNGKRHFSEV